MKLYGCQLRSVRNSRSGSRRACIGILNPAQNVRGRTKFRDVLNVSEMEQRAS
jgi:hypothetical protein